LTWVKLDDGFPSHPKLAEVGPLGLAMQVAALCYCNRYLTDGYLPRAAAATLLDFDGIGLIDGVFRGEDADWRIVSGLMVECELWDEVAGGFQIHDYLDYPPSRDAVLAERAKKKASGQAGGRASAKARAKAPAEACGQAEGQAESNPVPVPAPIPEEGQERDSSSASVSSTSRGDLPVEKELLTTRLIEGIGNHADDRTPLEVRVLAKRLPESSLNKVLESLAANSPRNRRSYVIGALKSELLEVGVAG